MSWEALIALTVATAGLLKIVFDVGMIRGSLDITLKQITGKQKEHEQQLQAHSQQLQSHSLKLAEHGPRLANLERGSKCQ